ncbi:MAG: hypothetical protein ACPGJS_07795 [Flammeovirgaceae bacterium]
MDVRKVESQQEFLEVVEIEKAAWGFDNLLESTPPHVMQASNKVGGLVLGAFHQNQMVGFCHTIPAFDSTLKAYHHMHSLGIYPHAKALHPGFAILAAHRLASLKMKVDKVTWTFDPLEARNANLYIRKVGAVVETPYIANMYGESLLGGINAGIPADRLIATWHLHESRVADRLNGVNLPSLALQQLQTNYPMLNFHDEKQEIPNQSFALEIPADFQALKLENLKKALQIRITIRKVMTQALNHGRRIVDFHSVLKGNERRNFYIIE